MREVVALLLVLGVVAAAWGLDRQRTCEAVLPAFSPLDDGAAEDSPALFLDHPVWRVRH